MSKVKKPRKSKVVDGVETFTTTMKYVCPIRGEVEQIVSVKRYPKQSVPETIGQDTLLSDLLDELDENGFHEVNNENTTK